MEYGFSKSVPVTHEADVIVLGGGPGGLGAAVMAARSGAKVLMVERYGAPGGMASFGEIHPFMDNHANGICLDKPVYVEWIAAMHKYQACASVPDADASKYEHRLISKDAAILAAEDLCQAAGVRLLYHHQFVDPIVNEGRIEAVILHSKSGLSAARAKVFIDATGDADVAARAGCEFEQGGPSGHSQPMTLCFKLSRVDRKRMPSRGEITRLYHQAKEQGRIDCLREDVLWFEWFDEDVIHFNTTRVIHKSGTNGQELSDAEVEARKQVRQYLEFFRTSVPGFERTQLHSMAHHIGVRETRRVRGLAYVTKEDFIARRKFPDAIARVRYMIDIHNPDGSGTEHMHLKDGEWYELPYGSIVPKDCRNLLVAGRPISVDHAIHSSMRVMPPAISVGQAAGVAAAMSAATGRSPREVDGVQVRQKLRELGANL